MEEEIDTEEQIKENYSSILEKIVEHPKFKKKQGINYDYCVATIADIFAGAQTSSLVRTANEFSLDAKVEGLNYAEQAWHNDALIGVTMLNLIDEESNDVVKKQLTKVRRLCGDTVHQLHLLKSRKDLMEEHQIDEEYIKTYNFATHQIGRYTIHYLKLMRQFDKVLYQNEIQEVLDLDQDNTSWIANHYTYGHIQNVRRSLLMGAYKKLKNGLIEKNEDKVYDAFLSMRAATIPFAVSTKRYQGSNMLRSAVSFIREEMPDRLNFFRYCIKTALKEEKN